jgi:hypothetical protein
VKYNKKIAFEIIFKCDLYTETEFLHSSDMDNLYIERYNDKFLLDGDYIILEGIDINKK